MEDENTGIELKEVRDWDVGKIISMNTKASVTKTRVLLEQWQSMS